MHVCASYLCSAHRGQKRVLDPLGLDLRLSVTMWMPYSLQEQQMLLTTKRAVLEMVF